MKTKRPASEVPFQISIAGFDGDGLDCIVTVRANSKEDYAERIREALEAHPIASSKEPKSEAVKCPRCGEECYDNRKRRGAEDRRPLIKCKKCGLLVWEKPKTPAEIEMKKLWEESQK